MTHFNLALEEGRCSCFGLYERKSLSSKYDFSLRRPLLADIEEPSAVELRASLGRQIVSKLPLQFRLENDGRFIAVTFTGKVLTVCDTLEALNKEIAEMHLKENYYIERFGHRIIAQI